MLVANCYYRGDSNTAFKLTPLFLVLFVQNRTKRTKNKGET